MNQYRLKQRKNNPPLPDFFPSALRTLPGHARLDFPVKRLLQLLVFSSIIGCVAPHSLFSQQETLQIKSRRLSIDTPRKQIAQTESRFLSIVAGGDVMVGHWTAPFLNKHGSDYPYRNFSEVLQDADVAFGNLEAPLADTGSAVEDKKFTFKVPTRHAKGLKTGGFNLLSLANNHILDYGIGGLEQTLVALDNIGMAYAGAGLTLDDAWQPAVVETRVGKVALLAFAMTFPTEFWATDEQGGTAYPYEKRLIRYLEYLEQQADFTVVSFHWGTEKKTTPNDYQIYFARLAIDHGADLILGHHPHVLQGLEIYKNRLIAYSLGNLAFSVYSGTAIDSMLLKVFMDREGLLYAKIIPLNIDNSEVLFQPTLASEKRKNRIIDALDSLSFDLNNEDIVGGTGLILGRRRGLNLKEPGTGAN